MKNAVVKLYSGVVLGHFFLLVVCLITFHLFLAALNLLLFVVSIFVAFQVDKIMNVVKIIRRNEGLGRREFTPEELTRWRLMYSHPVSDQLVY